MGIYKAPVGIVDSSLGRLLNRQIDYSHRYRIRTGTGMDSYNIESPLTFDSISWPWPWLFIDFFAGAVACSDTATSSPAFVELGPRCPHLTFPWPKCRKNLEEIFTGLGKWHHMRPHRRFEHLNDRYFKNGCDLPQFVCGPCDAFGGADSVYYWDTNVIHLCTNKLYTATDQQFYEILLHEMTHALQNCNKSHQSAGTVKKDCSILVKVEMEAYFCAGQCSSFGECLQKAAWSTCGVYCTTSEFWNVLPEVHHWFHTRRREGTLCEFRPNF